MSKLKVGDRVELLSFAGAESRPEKTLWRDGYRVWVGEQATIEVIDAHNNARVRLSNDLAGVWWRCEALRKLEDTEPTPQELYRLMAKHSGLGVGDRVCFVRLWERGEYGCELAPDSSDRERVGQEGIITTIGDFGNVGVKWSNGDFNRLPPFTLVKIQQPKFLAGDYEVSFNKDGSIEVDGINVPFEQLEAVYERAKARW